MPRPRITSRSKLRARKSVSQNVGGLVVGHLGERGTAREELVAVGAGQPLDALVSQDRVDEAAGTAVGVGDEDLLVAVGARLADPVADLVRDAFGAVVQVRREAGDVDAGQAAGHGHELAGERPTADHERPTLPRDGTRLVRPADQRAISGRRNGGFGRVLRRAVRVPDHRAPWGRLVRWLVRLADQALRIGGEDQRLRRRHVARR